MVVGTNGDRTDDHNLGSMKDGGKSYSFSFNDIDVGSIDHVLLIAHGDDHFCVEKVQVNSFTWDPLFQFECFSYTEDHKQGCEVVRFWSDGSDFQFPETPCQVIPPPTFAPTLSPTDSPTFSPTIAPTSAPTFSPSFSPTFSPSIAPTLAPSYSPTACPDLDMLTNSSDGTDIIIYPVTMTVNTGWMFDYLFNDTSMLTYYRSSTDTKYVGDTSNITCDEYGKHICYIHCETSATCLKASIQPQSDYLDQLIVHCGDTYACYEGNINISVTSIENMTIGCYKEFACSDVAIHASALSIDRSVNLENFTVICEDRNSCKDMIVNMSSIRMENVTIICVEAYSCSGMEIIMDDIQNDANINIHCAVSFSCDNMEIEIHDGPAQDTQLNVVCYELNSCRNMQITVDVNMEIGIAMTTYKYSDNIGITYSNPDNIKFLCGNNKDRRYVRYNTTTLWSDDELRGFAAEEYKSNRLPCDGITIDCSTDSKYEQWAELEYALNDEVINVTKILATRDQKKCYWLTELNQLFNVTLNGNCGPLPFYRHNITVDVDLTFLPIINNKTNISAINNCNTYFGSHENKNRSLREINNLFGITLSLSDDDPLIHRITSEPDTHLLPTSICPDAALQIYFALDSIEDDEQRINALFAKESEFHNESMKLLTNYFHGSAITSLELFYVTHTKHQSQTTVILISCALSISIIMIISYCIWRRKQVFVVDKVMILIIGIMKFDNQELDNPKEMENIQKLILLWRISYKYDVFVCNPDTLHCTKRDILTFLDQSMERLNYYDYKAVMVHIISHGSEHDKIDHFVTSDNKQLQLDAVKHIIKDSKASQDNPLLFKVIFYHACRGKNDYHSEKLESPPEFQRRTSGIKNGSNKYGNLFCGCCIQQSNRFKAMSQAVPANEPRRVRLQSEETILSHSETFPSIQIPITPVKSQRKKPKKNYVCIRHHERNFQKMEQEKEIKRRCRI